MSRIEPAALMNDGGCEWMYQRDETRDMWALTWKHPSGLLLTESVRESDFDSAKASLAEMLESDLNAFIGNRDKLDCWLCDIEPEVDVADDRGDDAVNEPEADPVPALHWCIDKIYTQWSDGAITEDFAHRFIEPEVFLDFKSNIFPTYEEALNHAIGIASCRV